MGFFVALVAFTDIRIWFLVIDHGQPRIRPVPSDKIALAASRAKVVERDEAPELHDMVERLCAMADLRSRRSPWSPPMCRTHSRPGATRKFGRRRDRGSGTGSSA